MFHFFQFPKFDEFWNFKKVLIYQLSLVRVHCMSIYIFYTVHTYNVRVQYSVQFEKIFKKQTDFPVPGTRGHRG